MSYKVSLLVLFVSLVAGSGCSDDRGVSISTDQNGQDVHSMQKLESISKEIGLVFSEECEVIHVHSLEAIVDPSWIAKIKIPKVLFASVKSSLLAKQTDETSFNNLLITTVDWWSLDRVVFEKQYAPTSHSIARISFTDDGENVFGYIQYITF